VYHDLLQNLGVKFHEIKAGQCKNAQSSTQPFTTDKRQYLEEKAHQVQALFLSQVKAMRPRANVDELAQAKVWTGPDALEQHLVDEIMTSHEFLWRLYTRDTHTLRVLQPKVEKSFLESKTTWWWWPVIKKWFF